MLKIVNLSVDVLNQPIIHDCTLTFYAGKTYCIMGPNGSGKSSLAYTIMGHPSYNLICGAMYVGEVDITNMSVQQRAQLGIFLAMQHPVEIQGLQVLHFLQELCAMSGNKSRAIEDVLNRVRPLLKIVGLDESILQRYVNVGFSGGEKKRFELLQMLILQPKIAILDELDSGVDIDGLHDIANALQWYKTVCPEVVIIMITHYRNIVQYVQPDHVYVMVSGSLVASGDSKLIDLIEQQGYQQYAKRS